MIRVNGADVMIKGCSLEILDEFMCVIRSAYDCMKQNYDEEFSNENIAEIIKIALASDDEEFNKHRRAYLEKMEKKVCDCDDCDKEKPLKGLFDFLDGIGKSDESEEDEPETECGVTVIKVQTPEEALDVINKIVREAQKKDGEE